LKATEGFARSNWCSTNKRSLSGTLGWVSWTIARLGGWTGYASERPPGPITMHNGLQRFVAMVEGASLVLGIT
jgi:hypothetical protein